MTFTQVNVIQVDIMLWVAVVVSVFIGLTVIIYCLGLIAALGRRDETEAETKEGSTVLE